MEKIKVLLADDHPMFRSGLKSVIISDPQLEVVGEVSRGDEAVTQAIIKRPNIIIMDINMPGIDGIEATKQIKEKNRDTKVILLTMYSDEAYLKEGLKAGASGYVLKKAVDMELLSAIRTVLNGENYIYPTLIPSLFTKSVNHDQEEKNDEGVLEEILSTREKEVLKYIALGYTHQEIADTLFISAKTVDTYKSRIMEKINVKKRSDLVRYALKQGIISHE
ncbi:response regulator transcription factor [Tepidibacillus sp. HK-1]|uniref:response regulator transcription factor n=1 Tax=Tepidibacillus sp. HK-1 TaxID=1883407 RepID=UPI000852AB9B|nr:response regulator transcription factor [Tepidibacillus sp. HK-1]GBF10492.1 oxygen regulatory protein NreC [Tepidibacillus sp. HK-1]